MTKIPQQRLATRQLLAAIDLFCRVKHMPQSRFGRNALGDPNFVGQLRDGRVCNEWTIRRVSNYIERNCQEEPS